jgi:hypothetical protein
LILRLNPNRPNLLYLTRRPFHSVSTGVENERQPRVAGSGLKGVPVKAVVLCTLSGQCSLFLNREGLMTRSERYLAKAEKCQQISDAADISGTKRLYGVMASQWRQLAEEADEIDKKPLLEKIRNAHFLRKIDKAEGAIRELVALA